MPEHLSYETVIGLEVHVQLGTRSKAFCADDASFGGAPNTHTSAVSLAHPGTLPRLNSRAVYYAVKLGLALGCEINRRSTFDRKNYFYADLPKGFQTTQDKNPICIGGQLTLDSGRTVRIHHIHLEEDAGKSLHDQDPFDSLIDLNRAGVPLLEIVTEPDLRSADEVAAFMTEMRRLVRWLDISDGNMEEGSLRCDVNVSVRKTGETRLGQRCEVKNVNSMKFARRAIAFEAARQIDMLEKGEKVQQETRGFDPAEGTTYSLREKEDAHDYRYFPEPDLPPVVIKEDVLEGIRSQMPPLPRSLKELFQNKYDLPANEAELLTQQHDTAFEFLTLIQVAELRSAETGQQIGTYSKLLSNLIINKLKPYAEAQGVETAEVAVYPLHWVELVEMIHDNRISSSIAYQRLVPAMFEKQGTSPVGLATELNLLQNTDSGFLEKTVEEVLTRFPEKVSEYRKGKKGLIGFFMGEVMKASKGKAEPKAATQLLEEKLKI
ncbi:MAG: Asp-tRNA(Asn)/Glu-tRNA(Gln) amidotransferase subunit GatB [Saprospiraceae bacterium]|nr:Asp-tRNA(Asn)/Glu-tRNA(Gln) amidotransferase subunit GatB [Saprospiraceae bacterium]